MPRPRYVLALLCAAYVAQCTFVGYTPTKALLTTRVSLTTWTTGRDPVTLGVGDSVAVEACIRDGQDGSMYFFVSDCARFHPLLFDFDTDAPRVVRLGRQGTIHALAPGHFKVRVRSMGKSSTLEGDVVERVSLALSVRDTTLRVGQEIVVGWSASRPDGSPAPLAELEFGSSTLETDHVAPMQTLPWGFPGAARITARHPGHGCYRLTGVNQTRWLSVVVVDEQGQTRDIDHHPTSPDRLESCGRSSPPLAPGERLAPPPTAAIDVPRIRAAASHFFVIEACLDTLGRRLGRLPKPGEEQGVVGRCLDAPTEAASTDGWRADDFRPSYPNFELNLEQSNGDRDGDYARVGYSDQDLVYVESARRGEKRIYGPTIHLQGDESQTVGAVAACAALHRERTGQLPPTLDSLLAFARAVWLAAPPSERPGSCYEKHFPRRAAGSPRDASEVIDESRRFVVRYAASGEGIAVTLRPLRYAETGVISLAYDEAHGMHRTLENRAATPGDQELVRGSTPWERWSLAEPPPQQAAIAPAP